MSAAKDITIGDLLEALGNPTGQPRQPTTQAKKYRRPNP